LAIITSFGDRPYWRARQAGKEFHIIFLVNPNRLAVRAIHARKRAVILIYFRTLASVRLEDDESLPAIGQISHCNFTNQMPRP
jgi:hypothetical protein